MFQRVNNIEIVDLDCANTSFYKGGVYCIAVRLKPMQCPSEAWLSIFRNFFNIRGYGHIEILRSENCFILHLPLDGVGFYEAKEAMRSIISVTKATNDKLQHTADSQTCMPLYTEDMNSLLFASFREVIYNGY